MAYLNAFLCGGLLCAVGQILIDRTRLTPARILTGYVVAGVFLSAVGLYQPLADWGGAGATVPLTGFGHALAKGVEKAVAEQGWLGVLTGGLSGTAAGITAAVTLLGGILAYFVSGRALRPLRSFVAQVEQVQPNNLADMKITEEVLPEFRQFSASFNEMLDRLDEGFSAQRQFTGNAAHELRTPLALMQAQLELFSAEHPDARPETADIIRLLREQTERMTQMTKTLLEMSELRSVPCTDRIELGPMAEEILTDLAPLAEKKGVALVCDGDGVMTGSDTLIYRLLFNLTENAIRYNRPNGTVRISIAEEETQIVVRVADSGCGIPEEYRRSIFQPFFRVDKSRSRAYGGVGLGLSLVWEIARLHGGEVLVEKSTEEGTTMAVRFPC